MTKEENSKIFVLILMIIIGIIALAFLTGSYFEMKSERDYWINISYEHCKLFNNLSETTDNLILNFVNDSFEMPKRFDCEIINQESKRYGRKLNKDNFNKNVRK